MNNPFPVTFGVCQRCGRRGPDYSNPGNEFAEATDTTGNGYELKLFRGQYLDDLCIKEILDDEAAEREVMENEHDQELLSSLGFSRDGSTLK